jgi:mannose-6-phosphate isomerase-like protein (cupin superfamily)
MAFSEMTETEGDMATVLGPRDGVVGSLGAIGVRFMIGGGESGGGFSLVEHPMAPHGLAAPLHRHSREDEYSFVLEGRVGALLGEEVVYGEPGDLIFKPRGQWHTFWNAGDTPARILEIISPAGFEQCFAELTDPTADPPDPAAMAAAGGRYGVEIDFESVPRLIAEYGLVFGPGAQ